MILPLHQSHSCSTLSRFLHFEICMMWIDSENINISISAAILITGGFGASQSAEVFHPWSNTLCQLPSLPNQRAGHVQAGPLLCGGFVFSTRRSCLKWSLQTGGWTTLPLRLPEERDDSSAWDHGDRLVIMGGSSYEARETSEGVSSDGAVTSYLFRIKYKTG